MTRNKAARDSCSYRRAKSCPTRTQSIVANTELLRLVLGTTAFTLAMLAVPTFMAVLKGMGVW